MTVATDPYLAPGRSAALASADERREFIRRTYLHLAGAILAFAAIEGLLLDSPIAAGFLGLLGATRYSWLIVLAAFMGISYLADRWARSDSSRQIQYLGLGLYVVAEAFIFLPILFIATRFSSPDVIPAAALMTGLLFAGLTFTAFTSGINFSFLRTALTVGGFVALGLIVASVFLGFDLGVIFAGAMVIFAGAAILYHTSAVLRDYRTDQYVAASLTLFASVALLFWYILRIVMAVSRR